MSSSWSSSAFIATNSMVCPRTRIVFVPTPKVACTSLKWALVRAEGAHRDSTHSLSAEFSRDQTIHDPASHRLPNLALLSRADRTEVLTGHGWVRFCVTRRPYERLASAWSNRILLGAAGAEAGAVVAAPPATNDVGPEFRRFVAELRLGDGRLLDDPHFRPQTELLGIGDLPYTDVVDLADLDRFIADLRRSSPTRSDLDTGRHRNRSLALPLDALYDRETARIVDDLYRRDFDELGYERQEFGAVAAPCLLDDDSLRLVEMIVEMNLRIGDLSRAASGRPLARFGPRRVRTAIGRRLRRREIRR